MPRANIKNRRKPRFYHVYNQGSKRGRATPRPVFVDREDKQYFLWLIGRHLGVAPTPKPRRGSYIHLRAWITLLAYCVMTTHFHLLVWQRDPRGIAELMNRVKAEYTKYFNKKYEDATPLFNGPVQAKEVTSLGYFKWLVAYIHNNHDDDLEYEFSSHRAWVDQDERPGWIDPAPAVKRFGNLDGYFSYLKQYSAKRRLDADLGHGRKRR